MEDAEAVLLQPAWGFFGVFDGHGGSQCSSFVARRFVEEISAGKEPLSDANAVKDLCLNIDAEYLETGQGSGSTGTFAFVTAPEERHGRYRLCIGNVGDSRVLLGHKDGSMFEGSGTDGALTRDHKPDHPDERARIERTGGTVMNSVGVARVNGDLALSRAFGDAKHKATGGPSQEERPVTADPQVLSLECNSDDFLMLVCDGISEGAFPNREVVHFASEQLEKCNGDPAAAATAVCRQAIKTGSKDNLLCMIVLLGSGSLAGPEEEFLPGPADNLRDSSFRRAYTGFAERAGLTLAEAVERRHCQERKMLQDADGHAKALEQAYESFGSGPPPDATTQERVSWVEAWLAGLIKAEEGGSAIPSHVLALKDATLETGGGPCGSSSTDCSSISSISRTSSGSSSSLSNESDIAASTDAQLVTPAKRGLSKFGVVRVVEADELASVLRVAPPDLDPEDLMGLAGSRGIVIEIDEEAQRAEVKFNGGREWLPISAIVSL